MYCRKCRYNVRGVASGACPECGRAFDPAEPKTFDPFLPAPRLGVVILGGAFVLLLLLQVLTLAGSAVIAPWPRALDSLVIALVPVGPLVAGWFTRGRVAVGAYGAASVLFGIAWVLHHFDPVDTQRAFLAHWWAPAVGVLVMAAVFVLVSNLAAAASWRARARWERFRTGRELRHLPRPRTVALTALGLVALVIGWALVQTLFVMWAEPVTRVDHHAQLGALRESLTGVTPDETYAAWAALEPHVLTAPSLIADVTSDRPRGEMDDGSVYFDYVLHGPALPAELDREHEALAKLQEAGIIDALRAHAAGPVGARPRVDPDGALLDELRGLSEVRALARARIAAMRIALDAGDFDELAAIFDEVVALARTVSYQGPAIDMLVATSTLALVTGELSRELTEASFPSETCRALMETLDRNALAPIEVSLAGERALFHDLIQRTYSDDGDGDGYAIPSAPLNVRLGLTAPTGPLTEFASAFTARFLQASRGEEIELYDALFELTLAEAARPTWVQWDDLSGYDRLSARANARFRMLNQWLAPPDRLLRADTFGRLDAIGTRTLLAIEMFTAQHGRPPAALDELVPDILPTVPIDPLSGRPLGYRRLDDGAEGGPFVLYSTGVDGVDDGGTFDVRRPALAKGELTVGLDLPLVVPRDDYAYYN